MGEHVKLVEPECVLSTSTHRKSVCKLKEMRRDSEQEEDGYCPFCSALCFCSQIILKS